MYADWSTLAVGVMIMYCCLYCPAVVQSIEIAVSLCIAACCCSYLPNRNTNATPIPVFLCTAFCLINCSRNEKNTATSCGGKPTPKRLRHVLEKKTPFVRPRGLAARITPVTTPEANLRTTLGPAPDATLQATPMATPPARQQKEEKE